LDIFCAICWLYIELQGSGVSHAGMLIAVTHINRRSLLTG
jgi:hypothetical protein